MIMGFLATLKRKTLATLRNAEMRFFQASALVRESRRHGLNPDLKHPRDINEKILWLLCHTYGRSYARYADKIAVRDYLAEKGFADLCVPLLGVWKRPEDIDFGALPERFVLKCNHDSGSARVVDKSAPDFDTEELRSFYRTKLKRRFGYSNGELYYNAIKPHILAEQYLEPSPGQSSIPDYKVWCFDGKPYCIWACINRKADSVEVRTFMPDWTPRPDADRPTEHYLAAGDIPRPEHLDQMLDAAAKLSHGFPEVRVDFYEAAGRLFFSEITFAAYGGRMDFHSPEFLLELGNQCRLPL